MRKIDITKTMRHVHDRDCPKCGFPETIFTRDVKSLAVLMEECSKKCGWFQMFKQPPKKRITSKQYDRQLARDKAESDEYDHATIHTS